MNVSSPHASRYCMWERGGGVECSKEDDKYMCFKPKNGWASHISTRCNTDTCTFTPTEVNWITQSVIQPLSAPRDDILNNTIQQVITCSGTGATYITSTETPNDTKERYCSSDINRIEATDDLYCKSTMRRIDDQSPYTQTYTCKKTSSNDSNILKAFVGGIIPTSNMRWD